MPRFSASMFRNKAYIGFRMINLQACFFVHLYEQKAKLYKLFEYLE